MIQKAIFSVVNNRRLFHTMMRAASIGQAPFAKEGFIRHLPLFLSDMTKSRSLPAIAAEPFRDRIQKIKQPKCAEKVAFYGGCLVDFAYPEMGEDVVRVLNKAGIEVVFPEGQTCCGAPARYSGAYEVAAQNSADNIKALLAEDVKYVVSVCPTCTVALKQDFAENLESVGRSAEAADAKKLAAKVVDFSTLADQLIQAGRLKFKPGIEPTKFTYHDSCHFKRTLHAEKTPRKLLQQAGHELVEMDECDMCCGMGGSYTLKMPEISAPILERKLTNIEKTGAPLLLIDCPGCVMQIRGGLDKRGSKVQVQHTVQRLAECLE
jgi:Fe-S oxidoreductase